MNRTIITNTFDYCDANGNSYRVKIIREFKDCPTADGIDRTELMSEAEFCDGPFAGKHATWIDANTVETPAGTRLKRV